jgi:CxxC motif-containing protein (DUF1111 family)
MRRAKQLWVMAFALACSCAIAGMWPASLGTTALAARFGRRSRATVSRDFAEARALFVKVWQPGEASPAGGDGLGPLFNENSCVGCHHLGGTGGAGGNDRNVTLLTAFSGRPQCEQGNAVFKGELEDLHPGFRNHTSVVLHKHATSLADDTRLENIRTYIAVQTRDDLVGLTRSARNTPALFGDGLIDQVSMTDLLDAEKRKFAAFPEIKGRVSRLRDGRLGRFGWKGQSASLRDFVLGACANELGLEVPGHHQVSLTPQSRFEPSQLKADLDNGEVELLVRFVASLPRPIFQPVAPLLMDSGRNLFDAVGCATCHAPRLGSVNGIFSDLLLHDLGDLFRDSGGGYGMSSSPGRVVDRSGPKEAPAASGEAGPTEWRTAPLWGVADSAPYLHDGRARTLDEAVRLHGGEAAETALRYARLSFNERQSVLAFLHSLSAPGRSRKSTDRSAKRSL